MTTARRLQATTSQLPTAELTGQVLDEIVRALSAATTTVQQTVVQDRQALSHSLQTLLASQHSQVASQLGDLREQLAVTQTNRTRTSVVRGATWEAPGRSG